MAPLSETGGSLFGRSEDADEGCGATEEGGEGDAGRVRDPSAGCDVKEAAAAAEEASSQSGGAKAQFVPSLRAVKSSLKRPQAARVGEDGLRKSAAQQFSKDSLTEVTPRESGP